MESPVRHEAPDFGFYIVDRVFRLRLDAGSAVQVGAPVKILYLEHDDPVKLIDFPPGVDHNAHPWCKLKIGSAGVVEQIIDSGKMIAVVFPEVSGFVAVPPACLDLIA